MMTEKSSLFGNLTFSRFTVGTDAERFLLALQAALTVKGEEAERSLKKALRLKRAMQRNSFRRYTFALAPAVVPPSGPVLRPSVEPDEHSAAICAVSERVLGLKTKSTDLKVTTSGHFLLKIVLGGLTDKPIQAVSARAEIASRMLQKPKFSSCAVHPLIVRQNGKAAAVSFQCVYKVSHA